MYDVVALGELLIDFTYVGTSDNQMRLFEQNPGGAPANVLCALSHFGHKVAFIGKVGDDMHGAFLKETLEKEQIDTGGLITDPNHFTTLAFVNVDAIGNRFFSFARKPGADTCLTTEELNREMLMNTKIFHVGSLSLTAEPARDATIEAIKTARKAGALISYDPNYRASLWSSEKEAVKQMRSILPVVDLMKLSDEEVELLTGERDVRKAALKLNNMGIRIVAVTCGGNGAIVAWNNEIIESPSFHVSVKDTTGAGDAFWGGFLHAYLSQEINNRRDVELCAKYGNATAALCCTKNGAIPAMPKLSEVENLMK